MTRRRLLQALAAMPVVGALAQCAGLRAESAEGYGHVTPENCLVMTGQSSTDARVYLDGREITSGVRELDDREGWIEEFARRPGPNGGMYPGRDGKLVRCRRYGRVELTFHGRTRS